MPPKTRTASHAKSALVTLCIGVLLPSLGISIANVALPTFAAGFQASFHETQWVILSYLLSITTLIVGAGRLGDLMDSRRLFLWGVAIFGFSSLTGGFAPSLFLLIIARLAQGVGAAILMSLSVALISRVVPKERIGSAMGLVGATSAMGTALGPSLGGGLLYLFGWQGVFLIHVPLTMILFFLAFKNLSPQEKKAAHLNKPFDYTGTFLLATCLASYALLMTLEETFFCKTNACFLMTCLISLGLFILTERKARFPLMPLSLFTQGASTGHLTMGIVTSGILMTNLVVGPYYLTHGMGLSTQIVGLVMSFGPLIVVLTGVPAGRLVDRYGTKPLTLVGLLSLSLGSFLLALIPVSFGIPGYLAPVALIAGGYALFQTANNTALMGDVTDQDRGMMSGLLNLSRYLGLMTGACAMGAVFAFATGTAHIETAPAQNVAVGMHATFAVTSTLGACIALVLLLRGWLRAQPR